MTAPRNPITAESTPALPALGEALGLWLRIGCLSFGGPAGQIALMHRMIVEERRWISDRRFLSALNFCSFLPGPEAQQLATYIGWLMHGAWGGAMAGMLFVLPGAFVMLALSWIFVAHGETPLIAGLFFGLKGAVLVLVIDALLRVARRALHGMTAWALAAAAFAALHLFDMPFPLVILVAGLAGALAGALAPGIFHPPSHGKGGAQAPALLDAYLAAHPGHLAALGKSARRAGLVALGLWALALLIAVPQGGVFAALALFFSKMAVVTFGGAYAVLAYVAQEAVEAYGWLSASEMLAGLGLAETTPGPLILVLQFVGFLAGFRAEAGLSGPTGGVAGAALTLWVTFAPCFVFVFLGAPLIENLQARPLFAHALAAITAAIVGVIANLALWFAVRVLFGTVREQHFGPIHIGLPDPASLDGRMALVAAVAALLTFALRQGLLRTLAASALLGLGLRLI